MATFLQLKDSVTDFFKDCIQFVGKYGFDQYIPEIQKRKTRVEENRLSIVTVGEAKRGKSSLLAALLEDDGLFPVDVEVTTCLATAVCYAEQEKVTVTFQDGSTKVIKRQEIPEYAAERYNSSNRKAVKWLTVETPNPKLKNGLTVVDTPGVGSLNPMHTEVTYGFLPSADLILFVSDAGAPLTEPELRFLKDVKKYCGNFLFVLTKKDISMDYQSIIEENKEKIETISGFPKDQITYVPVSATMRQAALHNKSERMSKSSNMLQFEKILLDTIARNRANIVINPPLGEVASILNEIDKEIHILSTGLNGTAQEQKELKEKLQELQQDRHKLQGNASWERDIAYGIEQIALEQQTIFTEFQNEALSRLDAKIKNDTYQKHPEQLLNEIISMAYTTSQQINEDGYEKLCKLKVDFETKTKMNLYDKIVKSDLTVDDDPGIVFEKQKILDRAIEGGRNVSMNTMGGTTAGGILGGVIGGILGILGGPGGIVAMASAGAAYGASLGALTGATVGIQKTVKQGGYSIGQVRNEISRYINQVVTGWRHSQTKYIKDMTYQLTKSLKDEIRQSSQVIEGDIKSLNTIVAQNESQRNESKKRLEGLKIEHYRLLQRLQAIRSIKVETFTESPNNAPTDQPVDGSAKRGYYSNLEE